MLTLFDPLPFKGVTPDWLDWEKKQAYKYAIEHDGFRYAVKQIVSMATDTPVKPD